MARTQSVLAGVRFLKGASEEGGAGADGDKNKFEKLKANRSQSKERKFVLAWGVCNDDMGQYKWEF